MFVKKIISILFLLILSVQLLPVESIGSMIFKQSLTEEVHEHSVNRINSLSEDKLNHHFEFSFPGCEILSNAPEKNYHIKDEALIKCFHLEVLLQPPNS
jgi:hypothetical protein